MQQKKQIKILKNSYNLRLILFLCSKMFRNIRKKIHFYKRAQMFVSDVFHTFDGKGLGELKSIDQITGCADYKIPLILRKFGVLEYSTGLADKIDNKIEIARHSNEEIEIRSAAVWGIEFIKQEAQKRFSKITSSEIN